MAHEAPTGSARPTKFSLTPHVGLTSESDFVNSTVQFSDGERDYISIEPDAGLQVGLELDYQFRPRLSGVLALSYASADARYVEDRNLRPDARMSTIRIQPGVMASVLQSGRFDLGAGGGLTIARTSVDRMVWNGFRISPTSTALGVFGAASFDVALSSRTSLHSHIALELTRPGYGNLEDELAMADGEFSSDVDHDTRSALLLGIGVKIGL
jgi:hypothetical protein